MLDNQFISLARTVMDHPMYFFPEPLDIYFAHTYSSAQTTHRISYVSIALGK